MTGGSMALSSGWSRPRVEGRAAARCRGARRPKPSEQGEPTRTGPAEKGRGPIERSLIGLGQKVADDWPGEPRSRGEERVADIELTSE